jgi:serine/threonine protein kinase
MFGVHENTMDPSGGGDLRSLASLARDLAGDVDSLKVFPSLMTFFDGSNSENGRFMAVSLQRWPSEKVSIREARMNKNNNSPLGASPAALQEMELLNQLHSLIPSPQGHPNLILPIAVSLTLEEASSHDSPEKASNHLFEPEKGTDDIFSLFRSSEDNERVAQKEKKKRNDLATGAHLVFHPTPFILQRFTTRSRRSSSESSGDKRLASSLLKAWFHDLLSALAHCHENHVVLRSLQPDQILIDHSGVAKLGGLYRATVLSDCERQNSTNALKSALKNARSRKSKGDESDEAPSSYVAPELLLGSTKHTKESDIWSMGCLFAHLLLHKSLFVGKDRASLLLAIFKIAGIPHKDNFPEGKEFPFYLEPPKRYKRGVVSALRHMLGDEKAQQNANEIDLLDRMLHLDPRKRIAAADALKHECMVEFIENCSSDEFRKQYVNDWLALKKRYLQANKSAEEDARKQECSMKREAWLMTASVQDYDDDGDDELYGDLVRGGEKRQKWS